MSFDARLQSGDLVISDDIEIIEDTDKLIQDSIKLLLTPLGGWFADPNYGTKLSIDLIGQAVPSWIGAQNTESMIRAAFQYYKAIQSSQIESGQLLSDAERLFKVAQVEVFRDDTDPRQFNTYLTLVPYNGEILTHKFKFNPGVAFDTGTNRITEFSF